MKSSFIVDHGAERRRPGRLAVQIGARPTEEATAFMAMYRVLLEHVDPESRQPTALKIFKARVGR